MHVVIDVPEQLHNRLDASLAKQFADIQRQLLGLVKSQDDSTNDFHRLMMGAMESQQETLVKAMERLLRVVNQSLISSKPSDALLDSVRGLKQVVADLPADLKDALDHQYHGVQERTMKVSVKPQVTVEMPRGFLSRIDTLEASLLAGLHRSRNRTFGSNY